MASETKTKGLTLETVLAPRLKKQFKARCKKLNVSMSQRLRELIQQDLKASKK